MDSRPFDDARRRHIHCCRNGEGFESTSHLRNEKGRTQVRPFRYGGEEGIQDPSTTRGVVISIAAAMEKGSNQPPISGTKKAAHKYDLFVMVGAGGFGPPKSETTDLQSAPFGHSGTLPYSVIARAGRWSWWTDSNPRPADYKSAALPAELHQRVSHATSLL